ncbi:hypothetical protein EGW08_017532, partial [Elysia chlorotica]
LEHWESLLLGPGGHHLPHGLPTGLFQGRPQVLSARVLVLVPRQVDVHAFTEILTIPAIQVVGDKQQKSSHRTLTKNTMSSTSKITKSFSIIIVDKLSPHVVFRETVVDTEVLNPRCKAFVQPQVTHVLHVPPQTSTYHCHEVAEPLMGQLVAHHEGHPLLAAGRRVLRVDQQGRLAVRDQTPVLHST